MNNPMGFLILRIFLVAVDHRLKNSARFNIFTVVFYAQIEYNNQNAPQLVS